MLENNFKLSYAEDKRKNGDGCEMSANTMFIKQHLEEIIYEIYILNNTPKPTPWFKRTFRLKKKGKKVNNTPKSTLWFKKVFRIKKKEKKVNNTSKTTPWFKRAFRLRKKGKS